MDERDPRFDQGKREEAAELYRSGLSERAVAEHLGLSKTRVRDLLDEAGVRRRSRTAAQRRRWKTVGRARTAEDSRSAPSAD